MTPVGCISDSEEIVKALWPNFQYDGTAAFKLSEKSPVPLALSAKNLPGGQAEVLNVCRIKRINHRPAESDADNSPDSISDTENWFNSDGDLEHPNGSEDNWEAENESDTELDNGGEDSKTPLQQNVSATPNVLRVIQPIRLSKKKAEVAFMTVNICNGGT